MRKVYEGGDEAHAKAVSVLARHMPAWRAIAKVFGLVKPAAVLTGKQLEELTVAGPEFGCAFRKAFPDTHISLKVHLVETHLVEFALRWHSTGLFSEDACDSIHAITNSLYRRYACIRSDERRMKLMNVALQVKQNKEIMRAADAVQQRRSHGKRQCVPEVTAPTAPVDPSRVPATLST